MKNALLFIHPDEPMKMSFTWFDQMKMVSMMQNYLTWDKKNLVNLFQI